MSKQPPPAPTASAVGPCPTVIKLVGHPGTVYNDERRMKETVRHTRKNLHT